MTYKYDDLVTVVVSVYNIEKYIADCLESLISQSYNNIEILCVNDGSIDNSLQILEKYKLLDKRINIFSQNNKGLSSTRNLGIDKATGKYIYFIDGDDFITEDYIHEMVDSIKKSNSKVVHNPSYIEYYGKNNKRNQLISKSLINAFESNDLTHSTWSKLFELNFLKLTDVRFKDGFLYEDYEFWNRFVAHLSDLSFCLNGHYYYRQRDNSIIDNSKKDSRYNNTILYCIKSIYEYQQNNKGLNYKPLYIGLLDDHLYYNAKKNRFRFILEVRSFLKSTDKGFYDILMPQSKKVYKKYTSHKVIKLLFKSIYKKL